MSAIPPFDAIFNMLLTTFGQPSFTISLLFLVVVTILLLAGLEGTIVGVVFLALVSFIGAYGFATYGYLGYAILVVCVGLSISLFRALQK